MVIILLSLSSYSKAVPKHLLKAREAISEIIEINSSRNHLTCFAFVNDILESTLAKEELEELSWLHKKVLASLPLSHHYPEKIPYHYALIAGYLAEKDNDGHFWGARKNIHEAMPGDILIYIDPGYDPDPSHRKPHQPSGTHVAFVDKIFKSESNDSIMMRIIDSTQRKKGRGISPNFYKNKNKSSLKAEGIPNLKHEMQRYVKVLLLWKRNTNI